MPEINLASTVDASVGTQTIEAITSAINRMNRQLQESITLANNETISSVKAEKAIIEKTKQLMALTMQYEKLQAAITIQAEREIALTHQKEQALNRLVKAANLAAASNTTTAAVPVSLNKPNKISGTQVMAQLDAAAYAQQLKEAYTSTQVQTQKMIAETGNWWKATKDYLTSSQAHWGMYAKFIASHAVWSAFWQVLSAAKEALAATMEFEKGVAEIRTISQDAQRSMIEWQTDIVALAATYGANVVDVTEGYYQAISNQVAKGAESTLFMKSALDLATASVSSTSASVEALSSVLNSYHLPASSAAEVSAKLFKIVELGRVRLEEMGNDIGNLTILSSTLGVTQEELGAAITTVTKTGLAWSKAGTLIRNVLQKLISPSAEMAEWFKSIGVESGQAAINTYTFAGVLQKLEESTLGATDEVGKLFREMRATTGALAFSGEGLKNYQKDLEIISKQSLPDFKKAVQIALATPAKEVSLALNNVKLQMMEAFGRPIIQLINSFDKNIMSLATAVKLLITAAQALLGQFLLLKGVPFIFNTIVAAGDRLKSVFNVWRIYSITLKEAASQAEIVALRTIAIRHTIQSLAGPLALIGGLISTHLVNSWMRAKAEMNEAITALNEVKEKIKFDTEQEQLNKYVQTLITGTGTYTQAILQNVAARRIALTKTSKLLDELAEKSISNLKSYSKNYSETLKKNIDELKKSIEESNKAIQASEKYIETLKASLADTLFSEKLEQLTNPDKVNALLARANEFSAASAEQYSSGNVEGARQQAEQAVVYLQKAKTAYKESVSVEGLSNKQKEAHYKKIAEFNSQIEGVVNSQVAAEEEINNKLRDRIKLEEELLKKKEETLKTIPAILDKLAEDIDQVSKSDKMLKFEGWTVGTRPAKELITGTVDATAEELKQAALVLGDTSLMKAATDAQLQATQEYWNQAEIERNKALAAEIIELKEQKEKKLTEYVDFYQKQGEIVKDGEKFISDLQTAASGRGIPELKKAIDGFSKSGYKSSDVFAVLAETIATAENEAESLNSKIQTVLKTVIAAPQIAPLALMFAGIMQLEKKNSEQIVETFSGADEQLRILSDAAFENEKSLRDKNLAQINQHYNDLIKAKDGMLKKSIALTKEEYDLTKKVVLDTRKAQEDSLESIFTKDYSYLGDLKNKVPQEISQLLDIIPQKIEQSTGILTERTINDLISFIGTVEQMVPATLSTMDQTTAEGKLVYGETKKTTTEIANNINTIKTNIDAWTQAQGITDEELIKAEAYTGEIHENTGEIVAKTLEASGAVEGLSENFKAAGDEVTPIVEKASTIVQAYQQVSEKLAEANKQMQGQVTASGAVKTNFEGIKTELNSAYQQLEPTNEGLVTIHTTAGTVTMAFSDWYSAISNVNSNLETTISMAEAVAKTIASIGGGGGGTINITTSGTVSTAKPGGQWQNIPGSETEAYRHAMESASIDAAQTAEQIAEFISPAAEEIISSANENTVQIVEAVNAVSNTVAASQAEQTVQEFKYGGRVRKYASGGFVDSVPAMLTPGEFVVNRQAAAQFTPLLEQINSMRPSSNINRTISVGDIHISVANKGAELDVRKLGEALRREIQRGTVVLA